MDHASRSCRFALALLGAGLAMPAVAQTRDDGALWLGYFASGRFGTKESALGDFRWWLEAQDRQRDEGEHFDLGIIRPGLGYALTDRITLWAGYAWVPTDAVRREPFDEHRVWQQLTLNFPTEGFTLQWRNRLEQRFIEDASETGWRLRELLKVTVPVTEDKRLFVSLWDELFFDLNDTAWGQRAGFRQNRAFAGLGWFADEARAISFEAGYVNQWIDRRDEDRLNHALAIWCFMSF